MHCSVTTHINLNLIHILINSVIEYGCSLTTVTDNFVCIFAFLLQAYITICDMLIIFSEHITQSPQYEPLVFKPDRNLQSQLGAFLNDKVFIEDDDGMYRYCYAIY